LTSSFLLLPSSTASLLSRPASLETNSRPTRDRTSLHLQPHSCSFGHPETLPGHTRSPTLLPAASATRIPRPQVPLTPSTSLVNQPVQQQPPAFRYSARRGLKNGPRLSCLTWTAICGMKKTESSWEVSG
jgi:hypothetical protein